MNKRVCPFELRRRRNRDKRYSRYGNLKEVLPSYRRRLFVKSTCSSNLGRIYDHAAGDGRELVKRTIQRVRYPPRRDAALKMLIITPFNKWYPGGDTVDFSTSHAPAPLQLYHNGGGEWGAGCCNYRRGQERHQLHDTRQAVKELTEKETDYTLTTGIRAV
jgi:hypothetical protein